MLEGLTYELKIGRKFILSSIDDAGNFANASAIHLCVLCEGEEESSVPFELEIYKISVENGAISCEQIFKYCLADSAEKNLKHEKFEMSKSKVVLLCDLRQRWLFCGESHEKKFAIQKSNKIFSKGLRKNIKSLEIQKLQSYK